MKQFTCKHCCQVIVFGREIIGAANIASEIMKHQLTCSSNIEPLVLPISVQRLKKGGKRLLKLNNTIFDPSQSLNGLKDSIGNLKVIAQELSDEQMESDCCTLHDLIIDLENSLKEKYLWK